MRLPFQRHDPWWDLEGRTVRRDRRLRKLLKIVVAWGIVALLIVVFKPLNALAASTAVDVDQRATIVVPYTPPCCH
jgi:hypothetical protein